MTRKIEQTPLEIKQNERLLTRVATYLFLRRDNDLLLTRRFQTGWEDGKYTLISGHVDKGESIINAMVREADEEAGIILNPKELQVVHVMHRKSNVTYMDFFLNINTWQGEPRIVEPNKCDDMQWFPVNNLPENTLPHVRLALEYSQNNIFFSEVGI